METLQGTPEEISAKKNARRIAAQITNDGMSRSEKLQTCFNWVMYGNYKIWRTPSLYKGWAAEFANDHFARNRLGCCISDACAFAYLAWAIGYTDVYVCLDSSTDMANTHAWTEVDGLVYDPLFAQAKSYANNYGVSYGTYGLSAEYKEKIK